MASFFTFPQAGFASTEIDRDLQRAIGLSDTVQQQISNSGVSPQSCNCSPALPQPQKPPVILMAGGGENGGGDLQDEDYGATWFLGEQPIRYCLEVAPNFGVSADEIGKTVDGAFETWKNYIAEKRIHYKLPKAEQPSVSRIYMNKCDGTEDLKFHFGTMTPEIQQIKSHYKNPAGFVHRISYNNETGRGKGLLWIAPPGSVVPSKKVPDWTLPNFLRGQLLHELGHVYGCEHVDRTIMRENIVSLLLPDTTLESRSQLDKIDGEKMLAFPENGTELSLKGRIRRLDNDASRSVFKKFSGRDSTGEITGVFKSDTRGKTMELRLKDDTGSVVIPITMTQEQGVGYYFPANVFKVSFQGKQTTKGVSGFVAYAQIQDANGKSYPASLEMNMADGMGGPFSIRFVDGQKRVDLFDTFSLDPSDYKKYGDLYYK